MAFVRSTDYSIQSTSEVMRTKQRIGYRAIAIDRHKNFAAMVERAQHRVGRYGTVLKTDKS